MKGKILYNRFVKAVSKVIFVILIMSVLLIAIMSSEIELYTTYIPDGSDDFYTSQILSSAVRNYSSVISHHMYYEIENYYLDNETYDEDEKNDEDWEDTDYGYKDIEVYYAGTTYYESMRHIIKGDIGDILKSSEMKERLANRLNSFCVNYGCRIRYNDEIVFSNIDDESEYNFINTADHTFYEGHVNYYSHICIDNYIRKNIIRGDDFYNYEKWYNFLNDNAAEIIVICGFAALLTIILAIYIILTAGYNEKGELQVSWLDNIPIELHILATTVVCFFVMELGSDTSAGGMIILIIGMMIAIGMAVINVESVISRLKNKVFLKKSIFGKILSVCINTIKNVFTNVFVNIDKKWKVCLCLGVVFLWEAMITMIMAADYMSGFGVMMWLFVKISEFIILMYFYNNLSDIRDGVRDMHNGVTDVNIDTKKMSGMFRQTAEYINEVSVGLDKAVSEKLKSEQLKTELITNVSHDIKTPLTSIINYVDLMKKENTDNEKLKEYLNVVDKQSMRLKKLTEDVIEASKAATGNINAEMVNLNVSEMLSQSLGEYESKFSEKNLQIIYNDTEIQKYVYADGKLLWRVLDNLFSNIYKYSLEGTRVYIDVNENEEYIKITMKNVSENQLNISSDELMQRFVRGDVSRNTSGNGLGLSIAESLVKLQNGILDININGDLFTSVLSLKKAESEAEK